nr:helix-turn-helix domain-containing protein [Candidatus Njordarchaeum guaymaensis]
MSGQEKVEDSRLLESLSQQLNLYDNLFPQVESKELQVLFALIRIYLARCDNPQLKQEHMMINPQLMKRLILTYFDPFSTPITRGLREALISRLNSIRKYRLTNAEVVRRALITCFYEEEKRIPRKQKTYLDVFMRNPGESFTKIAEQLGVTPQAVSSAYRSMQESDLFSLWGHPDYSAFKLRHFMVFFTVMREHSGSTEYLRRLLFDNSPFTLSLNGDVYEGSNWASFAIPNQDRELHEFRESLNELKGEFFRDLEITEIKSISTGSNFEFFDGKRWFFDPQLWTYGFFEFVRENKEILKKAAEMQYSFQPIRFQRLDFLIATILAANPFSSHNSIRNRLREFGYVVSRPTVTRRIERLTRSSEQSHDGEKAQSVIYPYLTYSGLGLSNLSLYLIECEEEYVEEMLYAVGYLPYYILSRTNNGLLLTIKSTSEDVAKFNYMIKGINEIRVVAHSNRFQSMGSRSILRLYDKWDEVRQKWSCSSGELNFVKRFEALP